MKKKVQGDKLGNLFLLLIILVVISLFIDLASLNVLYGLSSEIGLKGELATSRPELWREYSDCMDRAAENLRRSRESFNEGIYYLSDEELGRRRRIYDEAEEAYERDVARCWQNYESGMEDLEEEESRPVENPYRNYIINQAGGYYETV